MKNIRISDDAHKYLMMQRALTGVPANRQVENLIKKAQRNDDADQKKEAPRHNSR